MDKTDRVIKICSRIEELEYQLACKDMMRNDADDARKEIEALEIELDELGQWVDRFW